ncbi:MAG: GNAT family N-acetyltransferase [Gemmatimonadota bacterium]
MSALRVSVEPHAPREDVETVIRGLRQFNTSFIGEPNMQSVQIFLRNEHGAVVGGLLGHSVYRWMFVAKLWVSEEVRGRGLGSALIEAAETEARARDCLGLYLDTFEYQARPFYEKHGFELFGTLEGYPPGYRQFYLAKRLQPNP